MGLDAVELVMEVEDRFGIDLPNAETNRIRTVAELAALVMARLPSATVEESVTNEIRRLTAQQMGIPLEQVRPDSQFVRDLSMG